MRGVVGELVGLAFVGCGMSVFVVRYIRGVDVSQDGWGNVISVADSRGGRSTSAALAEGTAQRNGARPQSTIDGTSSASRPHEEARSVVVVGLLQLSPGASLRGLAFTKIAQSLKAATFPEKDKTTVDLWLDLSLATVMGPPGCQGDGTTVARY